MDKIYKNFADCFSMMAPTSCQELQNQLHERLGQALATVLLLPKASYYFGEATPALHLVNDLSCQIQMLYQALLHKLLNVNIGNQASLLFMVNKTATPLQLYYALCEKVYQVITLLHVFSEKLLDQNDDISFIRTLQEAFTYIHYLLEISIVDYPDLYLIAEPTSA